MAIQTRAKFSKASEGLTRRLSLMTAHTETRLKY